MIVLKLILFTLFISVSQCRIPDKVYCANKECNGPISKAKTLLSYTSVDPDLISFRGNSDAVVYMKSAGTNSDLWFVNIGGKTGFAINRFLREHKILEKNLEIVPFEARKEENVKPDKVQHPHEVFEGTTIYTTEAAVNNAQQDSSTESPMTTSSEDLTPSLNSAEETANQNVDVPNHAEDKVNVVPENLLVQNDEEPSTPKPELTSQTQASDENESVEQSSDITPDSTEQVLNNNSEKNEPLEAPQENQDLPKETPSETIPPKSLLTTFTDESLNSESAIEVPEKQDYLQNTLSEKEQSDSNEQNTSFLNNNLENVQAPEEISTETNIMPNGNSLNLNDFINPLEEHVEDPIKEPEVISTTETADTTNTETVVNPTNEPIVNPTTTEHIKEPEVIPTTETADTTNTETVVNPTNEPIVNPTTTEHIKEPEVIPTTETADTTNSETVVNPTNEPIVNPTTTEHIVPPLSDPIASQINQVIPPIYTNLNAENQYNNLPLVASIETNENAAPTEEDKASASMEIPQTVESVPATTETILPVSNEVELPTTTETLPPIYSEAATILPTLETIPPLVSMEGPPTTEIPPQESPPYNYITPPAPQIPEESYTNNEVQEPTPTPDTPSYPQAPVEQITAALPDTPEVIDSVPTEAPVQDENTEGFFTNMYSTVANIWPSSTEAPEALYSTEYPTYESEKADGNEGFSFLKYFKSTYYSIMGTSEESKALFAAVGETCFTDEFCDGTSNNGTNRLLTFLLTTASSVLLFTLGYYYIDNRRQDGRLIGTINSLQRDLLFTTKECEILKEELATTKNKLAGIEDSSFGMDDMVLSLKEEINELKATNDRLRNSLDDNEKLLRVSENTAGELQNTLGEVENTLSELLAERANSEEQIVELNGKIQAFEEEFISVSRERDNFQLKYVSAESALEELKKQKKQFDEINQLLATANNTIELQKHEIEALKEAIKDLKSGMSADIDVTSFIDHTEIKAKLSKALQEKSTFESKFETEYKERTRLAEELKTTQETLTTTNQTATEALTRLEVLGKYFQEREGELLKELSTKESLWLSKQGESASTVEKIEILQQEVQRYKEKCDALTLELAEQESSRRSALSEVESRAHAAWLEARSAKREADAARDEAAALRRKLAALSVADGAISPHHKVSSPLESGEPPLLPPPLPPMFLPPPLLPPLPRPPPLGRLPSPHPPRYGERRYTPDSRYSPESRYSPDSRYSPETVRYSPDSRYSPRSRRSPYSPRSRRRSRSRERYEDPRVTRSRNGPAPPPIDTETEYNSDSPSRQPRRRGRYSRHSGPSSGSGCSSESDK